MIEKLITSRRNVIDFARYQQDRAVGKAQAISARVCRHCGAALSDGENEDECSSALNTRAAFVRRTAEVLRGVNAVVVIPGAQEARPGMTIAPKRAGRH